MTCPTNFLAPVGITPLAPAVALDVPGATRIHAIMHERCGITTDTAILLSRVPEIPQGLPVQRPDAPRLSCGTRNFLPPVAFQKAVADRIL